MIGYAARKDGGQKAIIRGTLPLKARAHGRDDDFFLLVELNDDNGYLNQSFIDRAVSCCFVLFRAVSAGL